MTQRLEAALIAGRISAILIVLNSAGALAQRPGVPPGWADAPTPGRGRDTRGEFTTQPGEAFPLYLSVEGDHSQALDLRGAVTSLAVTARVEFRHPQGLVRVVAVSDSGLDLLVYESYPLLEDALEFRVDGVCEETCELDGLHLTGLKVQVQGALLALERFTLTRSQLPSTAVGARKQSQDDYKIARINLGSGPAKRSWAARESEVSILPYAEKAGLFLPRRGPGPRLAPNLQGFEYYAGGVFVPPPVDLSAAAIGGGEVPSVSDTPCAHTAVIRFDWRNRHGRNFVPPRVLSQGTCGNCYAAAAIQATEGRFNTYYNRNLDYRLSLQEATCDSGDYCQNYLACGARDGGCSGGHPQMTFNRLLERNGIPGEETWGYTSSNRSCSCASSCGALCSCSSATTYKIADAVVVPASGGLAPIKDAVRRGPITMCFESLLHCMAAIGYEDYQCTDGSVDTLFIFKNSYGPGWGEFYSDPQGVGGWGWIRLRVNTNDFIYDDYAPDWITGDTWGASTREPIGPYVVGATAPQGACEDLDGDGYCNWGSNSTPPSGVTCPAQCYANGILKSADVNDADASNCGESACGTLQSFIGACGSGGCPSCSAGAERLTASPTACCVPNGAVCAGKVCGTVSNDGCGWARRCGTCPDSQVCVNGACCTRLTAAQACGTKKCGTVADGCGGTVRCGTCGAHQYCGSGNYCYCSAPYHNCGEPPPDLPTCLSGSQHCP